MKDFNNAALYSELSIFECGKEDCVKNKAISLSKKSYHLFHYVSSGRGTLLLNNKEYSLGKGTIFFIPKNTGAIYYPDKEKPWSYVWVGFSGEKAQQFLDYLDINIDNPIIHDDHKTYKKYFDDLVSRYTVNGQIDIFALGALYQFFGELFYQEEGKSGVHPTKVTVQLAKDFILNNYQFDISVDDIARNANVTPNYLSAIFQKEENMTTKSFLIQVRMEKALELLQSSHFKVGEVSAMVGYSNQLYFSGEFKKYYGHSPIYYLKKENIENEK